MNPNVNKYLVCRSDVWVLQKGCDPQVEKPCAKTPERKGVGLTGLHHIIGSGFD